VTRITCAKPGVHTKQVSKKSETAPDLSYARKVPAAAVHESDEAWKARCVDHVDKDPITLVSTYRYKAGVADCP
jgi:hypothetical protein